jgi:hypothetical protein
MAKTEISMKLIFIPLIMLAICLSRTASAKDIFDRDNLVAWCIVPFDAKKRTPAQRAEMLDRLKIKKFAYDWRAEHLPTFEKELDELTRRDIQLTAIWFPSELNADAHFLLDTLGRHGMAPDLWVTMQAKDLDTALAAIRPVAAAAHKANARLGLYNHGGWFGEPENQIAIINQLAKEDITLKGAVGIVYNLHHGHDHLDRFPALLEKMKPHLFCLNLNGMTKEGDKTNQKILPLGQGDLDLQLLKTIRDSGYTGPIGILNHTDEDAEGRLMDNLDGLDWLVAKLNGKDPGQAPKPRTYRP